MTLPSFAQEEECTCGGRCHRPPLPFQAQPTLLPTSDPAILEQGAAELPWSLPVFQVPPESLGPLPCLRGSSTLLTLKFFFWLCHKACGI